DAIICVDANRCITFFNDGARRIFGYSADEILGCDLDRLIPQRFKPAHDAHIAAFGRSAVVARQMGERSVISGVRKSGEEFPAEAAIAKMIGPDGPIYSVVLRDVTAQRQAEAVNHRLLADTEAALRARDDVLGLVSHDLRNPVNAVKMLAAAILRTAEQEVSGTLPPAMVDHASVMLQAANQMDALIQDLLDVSRLESGRLHLDIVPTKLADVLREAANTLSPAAHERQVSIRIQLPEHLPPLAADPDRLTQLLSNLIGNSIKYTAAHGSVVITASQRDGKVAIQVTDNGTGIAPEELPLVFDRFWQSRRTNRSGAGLGLAIARGIVLAHGGEITIDSTLGEGTVVEFSLPTM
ncbi:MAG: PAS domain-containing sensor histidine kinase, partial [Phycisphaerae bacterium]|nr:PAS domain-containing sensor histidine kinase [Gemmatimonadaceae bacterium]